MIYNFGNKQIYINIGGNDFEKLKNGIWELGFINDNPGITDTNNDKFYYTQINKEIKSENLRSFHNKVNVKLINGKKVNKHIIHWNPSNGYFCVSNDYFWYKSDNNKDNYKKYDYINDKSDFILDNV